MTLGATPDQKPNGPLFARHASDHVRWLSAEPAAFKRAQDEDKLVFVQLGSAYGGAYSAAHTEGERAFREPQLAEHLNENYVSVLVDTDEQPQWERLLAQALSVLGATTRRPSLGIFTPQGELFFASGALPMQADQGPSLRGLLLEALQLKRTQRDEFNAQTQRITEQLLERRGATADTDAPAFLGRDVIRNARTALARAFDAAFYGFGQGAKWAHTPALEFLLEQASLHKNTEAERMALLSLAAMSSGGMYDQLWGGFFEGTTDRQLNHPLFHKRLGQNAELVRLYLHAFQLTHHEPLRRVATETLTFLTQHFKAPQGGFFLASHAETPQGEHYLWSRRQLKKALGEPAATHFAHFYGLDTGAATDTVGHLQARKSLSRVASDLGIAEAELIASLHSSRTQLQELRLRRAGLLLDDRLVTADNAAIVSALSMCALVLDDPDHLEPAQQTAALFWSARSSQGMLPRVLGQSQDAGLLDHVLFLRALVDLHQATLEPRYLEWALQMSEDITTHFVRPAHATDGALSCVAQGDQTNMGSSRLGWPKALQLLLGGEQDSTFGHPVGLLSLELRRLSALRQDAKMLACATEIVRGYAPLLRRAPHTACALVRAIDHLLAPALLLHVPCHQLARTSLQRVAATQLSPRALFITESPSTVASDGLTVSESVIHARPTSSNAVKEQWATYEKSVTDARRNQLFSSLTLGVSSPGGTQAALMNVRPDRVVQFQDLSLSRLGLGGYRIGLDDPAHARAVRLALTQGVNVIDTSPSFALGDAQRAVGSVVNRLIASGDIKREGLFFITKLGVAITEDAELLEARRLSPHPPRATVALHTPQGDTTSAASFKHGAFSLDPDFLSTQITASLERLGVAQLELCLLNSPEHLLVAGYDQTRLKASLMDAFARLDQEVRAGRIQGYGVMSNTLTTRGAAHSNPLTALVLEDILEWAAEQNPAHRLWAIEAPANLVQDAPYAMTDHAVFRRAKHYGLLTIACRPLSAIVDGALLRLTPPPEVNDGARADQWTSAKYKVAALEAEFETTWAVQLRLTGRASKAPVLPLSASLATTLEALQTRQQFDHAEATLVTPRLRALLAQLDRAFVGQAAFAAFKVKYIQAVGGYLACLREVCNDKHRRLLEELATRHVSAPTLRPAQRDRFLSQSWPQRAVATLLDSECVDIVLLGMRTEEHVLGMKSLIELPS